MLQLLKLFIIKNSINAFKNILKGFISGFQLDFRKFFIFLVDVRILKGQYILKEPFGFGRLGNIKEIPKHFKYIV